jgi:hypothetical protein
MSEANEIATLRLALEKSVALQSHYAKLLNIHDGGKRIDFANAAAWIARLVEMDKTKFPDGGKITLAEFSTLRGQCHIIVIEEEERQMILRSLAVSAVQSPGFDYCLSEIAQKMDNKNAEGKPAMFEQFKTIFAAS